MLPFVLGFLSFFHCCVKSRNMFVVIFWESPSSACYEWDEHEFDWLRVCIEGSLFASGLAMTPRKVIPPILRKPSQCTVRNSLQNKKVQAHVICQPPSYTYLWKDGMHFLVYIASSKVSRSSLSDSLTYINRVHHAKNKPVLWSNLSLPAQRLRFASMSQIACRQSAPMTWRQSVSSPRAQPAAGSPSTKQRSSITARKHRRKVEGQPPTHSYHPL